MTIYLHGFRYMPRNCLCRHWTKVTKLLRLGLQTMCHVSCVHIRKALTDLSPLTLFGSSIWEERGFDWSSQYRMHQHVSTRMVKRALPPQSLRIHNNTTTTTSSFNVNMPVALCKHFSSLLQHIIPFWSCSKHNFHHMACK